MSGGSLRVHDAPGAFEAVLTLPTLQSFPILVVDDNADFLRLVQRYADGTRYQLITTRQPDSALALADESRPRIIVLDVMMPGLDGWELLSRLRQHPGVDQIPVVVCTIVANESLALSLGASGYLQKPVTREAFLAALDRQVALLGD